MKKMVLVFTLAAFALSGSAFAQDPTYFDNIGLYLTPGGYADPFNVDGSGSCGNTTIDTPFTAYVVLSRLTNPEVWAWEAKIIPSNMLLLQTTINGDNINAGSRPNEYIVGLSAPLFAVDNAVVVAEMTFMINSFYNDFSQPGYVFVEGIYFSTLPSGLPAYLEASGSAGVELHTALGDPGNPQLTINGDCVGVGVEASSWGNLKSLYR